ncbi:MAG: M4 family metallopeptidase [candidate division Zixibacteria bacterium]|nr:M4 family metallopeptidase [candidate division Zixibacteria bacterium]
MRDDKEHIDVSTWNDTLYTLEDLTRQSNINPHNHNGTMSAGSDFETSRGAFWVNDKGNVWTDTAQASGVDAHVYSGWIYDYLNVKLSGKAVDSLDNIGMSNFVDEAQFGFDNACYCDRGTLFIGAESTKHSFAAGLDILAHEWGHALIGFTSKMTKSNNGETAALNESFSDMFGVSVGFTYNDRDWEMGDDVFKTGPGRLRDLSDPTREGDADTYRDTTRGWRRVTGCVPVCQLQDPQFNDCCYSHTNNGVPNKMFYLLAEGGFFNDITVTGIGIDSAMKVMYLANETRRWRETTNFLEARIGSIQIADSLNPSWGQELRKAWDAVNVCDKGDVNGDGTKSPADIVELLLCAFTDPSYCNPCEGDMNCDWQFTPSDVVIELGVVFAGSYNGKQDGCPDP